MSIKWNEYTWYSKTLAAIFFIVVLPIWAFYMGSQYNSAYQSYVVFPAHVATTTDSVTTPQSGSGVEGWKVCSNQNANCTLEYPADMTYRADRFQTVFTIATSSYFHTPLVAENPTITITASTTCLQVTNNAGEVKTAGQFKTDYAVFDKSTWSDIGAGQLYQGTVYQTKFNGICYRAELFVHSANGAGFYYNDPVQIKNTDAAHAQDLKNLLKVYETMVSTIKF